MLKFISVFAIMEVFWIDQTQTTIIKFQLNVDHTATCDIVLVIVFQPVRIIYSRQHFYI